MSDVVEEVGGLGAPYWLDMESGVREFGEFSLTLCRQICRAIYGPTRSKRAAAAPEIEAFAALDKLMQERWRGWFWQARNGFSRDGEGWHEVVLQWSFEDVDEGESLTKFRGLGGTLAQAAVAAFVEAQKAFPDKAGF